jgi:hypothetical protein
VQGVKCPGIGSTVSLQIAEVGPLSTQGPHLDVASYILAQILDSLHALILPILSPFALVYIEAMTFAKS